MKIFGDNVSSYTGEAKKAAAAYNRRKDVLLKATSVQIRDVHNEVSFTVSNPNGNEIVYYMKNGRLRTDYKDTGR